MEKAKAGELYRADGARMNPNSIANLKPAENLRTMDPKKRREAQQKGAAISNERQAKRRTIRDICETLLSLELPNKDAITDDDAREMAEKMSEATGKPVTVYDAIACAQAAAAMQGNVKAAGFIRDSAGDKPGENVRLDADIMTDGDRKLLAKLQAMMGVEAED